MSLVILVRHGESTANAEERVSGQDDFALTDKGRHQAQETAKTLQGVPIDQAFVSELQRARETLHEIQTILNLPDLPTTITPTLNERDFGVLTGKPKSETAALLGGPEAYRQMARSWDVPAEGGESLKDVSARIMPYFQQTILPIVQAGKNVIVVSHHQTLRALIKHLDNVSDHDVLELELANAQATIYEYSQGTLVKKAHP